VIVALVVTVASEVIAVLIAVAVVIDRVVAVVVVAVIVALVALILPTPSTSRLSLLRKSVNNTATYASLLCYALRNTVFSVVQLTSFLLASFSPSILLVVCHFTPQPLLPRKAIEQRPISSRHCCLVRSAFCYGLRGDISVVFASRTV